MSFKSLLVIGIDAITPTRLPRLLHDAGCTVTLLAPPGFCVTRSRYVDTRLRASADLGKLAAALKEHLLSTPRYDLVVIGDEAVLHEIARHRYEPWLDLCFPVNRRTQAFDIITSKHRFIEACRDAGLRVPRSFIASAAADFEQARSKLAFPLMLKLKTSLSGSGVRKIDTPGQLDQARLELSDNYPVMVEEFVDGPGAWHRNSLPQRQAVVLELVPGPAALAHPSGRFVPEADRRPSRHRTDSKDGRRNNRLQRLLRSRLDPGPARRSSVSSVQSAGHARPPPRLHGKS